MAKDSDLSARAGPLSDLLSADGPERMSAVLAGNALLLSPAAQDALAQLATARALDGNQDGWREFIDAHAGILRQTAELGSDPRGDAPAGGLMALGIGTEEALGVFQVFRPRKW